MEDKKSANKRGAGFGGAGWQRLDNTANIFPAIATQTMTNVYRISAVLDEDVDGELLQEALDEVLPLFDAFNVRMRKGVFWNYFETNQKEAPRVIIEDDYPCRYIEPYENNSYLFRVTYYRTRINLEVFHALADGMGGFNFLRELVYCYLRLRHPDIARAARAGLSDATSLNTEDGYLKNYKKMRAKGYKTARAVEVKGGKLKDGAFGVMHGYMSVEELKNVCKKYGVTINEYLVGLMAYSIYAEYLRGQASLKPIAVCVPVNLRPYFDSMTTRNFFVMVSASFVPQKDGLAFSDVLNEVVKNLRSQINKEHLEEIFSYNVSNQKNILLRPVPFFIKSMAMKLVYASSARACTTTLTNVGKIEMEEPYKERVKRFCAMISVSKGQNIKGAVCSYNGELSCTFSSILSDASIQRRFFSTLAKEGVDVVVESNGVYYD